MNESAEARRPVDPDPAPELAFRGPELRQRFTTDHGCGAPPAGFVLSSWQILKGLLTKRTARDEIEGDTGPLTELTFLVPELRQRAATGGRALPAALLIEEVLGEVERVSLVSVSDIDGTVRVWANGDGPDLVEGLKERIEELGYRVAEPAA